MTKDKALFKWFSDFGMDAYVSTAVPDPVPLPYLTYEYIDGDFGDEDIPITVNLWFRTTSEAIPNEAARRFRKYIEENPIIKCDEGRIWVKTGKPFSQSLIDGDTSIKRRYINITLEFLTL